MLFSKQDVYSLRLAELKNNFITLLIYVMTKFLYEANQREDQSKLNQKYFKTNVINRDMLAASIEVPSSVGIDKGLSSSPINNNLCLIFHKG